MELVDKIKAKARESVKRIVLPEGDEPRTVAAAKIIRDEGVAEPILLTKDLIETPSNKPKLDSYAAVLLSHKRPAGKVFSVGFYPIEGNASYSEMAALYRDYLLKNGLLQKSDAGQRDCMITFVGGALFGFLAHGFFVGGLHRGDVGL